jgi:hypothetical protein
MALHPLTRDYTLSVRLRDRDANWWIQHDSTPAGGAIPTLKWIRGTQVSDLRQLNPPDDAGSGQALLELLVYDAFTGAHLPPLDERLLAHGPPVSLGEVMVGAPP